MGSFWSWLNCPGNEGDLLIFKDCNHHDHYAVNVGNGYVVHTTPIQSHGMEGSPDSNMCCTNSKLAKIKKEMYTDIIKQGEKKYEVRVRNLSTLKDQERLAIKEIVYRAHYGFESINIWRTLLFPFRVIINSVRGSVDRNINWKDKETLSSSEIVKRACSRIGMDDYSSSLNNCENFARWCRYGKKHRHPADIERDIDEIVQGVHLNGLKTMDLPKGTDPAYIKENIDEIAQAIHRINVTQFQHPSGLIIPRRLDLYEAREQVDIGEVGDLVICTRFGLYDHYHVNVGYGYLVHTNPVSDGQIGSADSLFCVIPSNIAVIKLDYSSDVVKTTDIVKIENAMTWRGKERRPIEDIVERALSRIGERGYNLTRENCEHFARDCRYGEKASSQVFYLYAILVGLIAIVLFYLLHTI